MKKVFLVAGLAWGDEGKGSVTDYLVRKHKAGLVVRYNGGAQAAHNVVTSEGLQHTFSQFGSGTFVPGVRTFLSRFTIVNPFNMFTEAWHLANCGVTDAMARTTVSDEALIVTPYQQALNKLTELSRGENRHGSCGQGIGQTRSDHLAYGDNVLFAGDTGDEKRTRMKLNFIRERAKEKVEDLEGSKLPDTCSVNQMLRLFEYDQPVDQDGYKVWSGVVNIGEEAFDDDVIVFEGAQGVLLDETHGQAPHNTWTDCTFNNCWKVLGKRYWESVPHVEKVGVIRSYMTRHGAGPFPSEDQLLSYPEPHNEESEWQGKFRFGKLDVPLIKRSIEIMGGVDWIAMNHLDQFSIPKDSLGAIAYNLGAEITLKGYGPTANDKSSIEAYSERRGLDNKTIVNYT